MNALPQPQRVSIDFKAGARMGYRHKVTTLRAAKRAMRWLQSPLHRGEKMPTHISRKATLLNVYAAPPEKKNGTKV